MVAAKRGRPRKAKRSVGKRLGAKRLRRIFNPTPTFTETYQAKRSGTPLVLGPNAGFLLTTAIDQIDQIAQYSALYTKYKIVKASWLLLPIFSAGSSDQNSTAYNNSQGQPYVGDARVVYSIQDSPNEQVPANEQAVLQDNGCKIKMVRGKLTIRARPVPQLQLANGVYETERQSPWLNFDTVAGFTAPTHYGVQGWITQNISGAPPLNQGYYVYVKVTFTLKDPR